MFETTDRRSFLRGSALFAAAIGLKVASPAAAQEQNQDQDQSQSKPQEKKDPFTNDEKGKSGEKTYIDQEGREYRICPQCALQHVQARSYVGVRQLRLQLRRVDLPARRRPAPGRPPAAPGVCVYRHGAGD